MTRSRFAITVLSSVILIPAALVAQGHAPRPTAPALAMTSLSGRDLFQFYCASCHGRDGKGDGPVATSLKQVPPDLTKIAARHEGRFPTQDIERFVSGDALPAAHGQREMPVWGPIFMSFEPHDRLTRIRIENVVAFVESLQAR